MKVITTFKTKVINSGIKTECPALNIVYMSENTILLESRFFSDVELDYYRTIRKWKGMYYISSAIHLKHTTFEKMFDGYLYELEDELIHSKRKQK